MIDVIIAALQNAIIGAVGTAVYGLTGYIKNLGKDPKIEFDYSQIGYTVLAGAVIGGFTGTVVQDPIAISTMAVSLTEIGKNVLKGFGILENKKSKK